MGKFLQSLRIGGLGQRHRHRPGKSFKVKVILAQVVLKLFQGQSALSDFPQERVGENPVPDWFGLVSRAGFSIRFGAATTGSTDGPRSSSQGGCVPTLISWGIVPPFHPKSTRMVETEELIISFSHAA